MNANFGLVDELEKPIRDKRVKREKIAERALAAIHDWTSMAGITSMTPVEAHTPQHG